jgi:hypothetical protein
MTTDPITRLQLARDEVDRVFSQGHRGGQPQRSGRRDAERGPRGAAPAVASLAPSATPERKARTWHHSRPPATVAQHDGAVAGATQGAFDLPPPRASG